MEDIPLYQIEREGESRREERGGIVERGEKEGREGEKEGKEL